MAHVTVRPATLDDLSFVSQDGYIADDIIRRKILNMEVYVAFLKSRPIGYLRLEYLWSTVPYIGLIWVQEQNRGMGIGTAILDYVERVLRTQGYSMLYSSSQCNEPAPQAWHRRSGFQECGIINGINHDGIGEIFFRKGL